MRQLFGRRRRLACRAEYDAVLGAPLLRFRRGPCVLMARASEAGEVRLGLIVAKRVLRRAVDRNRAKRVLRESFRRRADLPPLDVVVRVVSGAPLQMGQADHLFATLASILAKRRGC